MQRIAAIEQVADEVPHNFDHVGRDHLRLELIEGRALRRRVPIDRELHGGQDFRPVLVELICVPGVDAIAEVEVLRHRIAFDLRRALAYDVFNVGEIAPPVPLTERLDDSIANDVLVRQPHPSGVAPHEAVYPLTKWSHRNDVFGERDGL